MFSAPPASTHSASPSATARAASITLMRPEAHAMLIVNAGTASGRPLRRTTWRARLGPFPAWRAWPNITCSTTSRGTPARSSAARAATAPSSAAGTPASPPPNFPIGVRTAPATRTLRPFTLREIHPDGLGLRVALERGGAEQPAVTALLVAAERSGRVVAVVRVHPDRARLEA